ncbi:hypothetical protein ACQKLX_08110 [Bosea sp. NPDC003192]|uniref:hypothetical protein n=1 Tax=Bosea sp. NPDC003192 TaxID=3390551 RepID=UPI003CFE05BA
MQWLPTALVALGLAKAQAAYGTVVVNAAFIAMALPLSVFLPKVDPRKLLLGMFAEHPVKYLSTDSVGTSLEFM